MEDQIRRTVLREVFEAISGSIAWASDERFEHYPLDVQVSLQPPILRHSIALLQAIAQLNEEQCAQSVQQKEAELNRRSKLAQDRAMKSLEQRCLVDKQAIRIEAEADKKQLGIEIARVKKRLIEAEREKHQATCEKAQAQRDARNARNEVQVLNSRVRELDKGLVKKSEDFNELEKLKESEEEGRKCEIQLLKEQVLNLEAKLNNQQTLWEEKHLATEKAAAEALKQTKSDLQKEKEMELSRQVQTELKLFKKQVNSVFKKHRNTNSVVELFTKELSLEHEDDLSTFVNSIAALKHESTKASRDCQIILKDYAEMKQRLHAMGCASLEDLSLQHASLKEELEQMKDKKAEKDLQIEELCTTIDDLTTKEEQGRELLRDIGNKVEDLQFQLQRSLEEHETTKQSKDNISQELETQREQLEDCKQQLESLKDELSQEQEEKLRVQEDRESLNNQLQHLESSTQSTLLELSQHHASQLASTLRDLRTRWFGNSSTNQGVLEVLKDCLCDATTNSGVRALKLASKTRTARQPKRKSNSAINCMLTRVRTELESIVLASDLESILANLKLSVQSSQTLDPEGKGSSEMLEDDKRVRLSSSGCQQDSVMDHQEYKMELLNLECCLFWTILDNRWRREDPVEVSESTQDPKQSSNRTSNLNERSKASPLAANRLRTEQRMKDRKLKTSTELKSNSNPLTNQSLQTEGLQFFKDKEAAEILEIISVLKGYLHNQQINEPKTDPSPKTQNQAH